jgi:NADH-ubiquinone oxidoreductase chain 1
LYEKDCCTLAPQKRVVPSHVKSQALWVICILVGLAFIVLLEPRVLGYVHIRKGPNKVGFVCLFQHFSDAIKMFTREQYFPLVSNYLTIFLQSLVCSFPVKLSITSHYLHLYVNYEDTL